MPYMYRQPPFLTPRCISYAGKSTIAITCKSMEQHTLYIILWHSYTELSLYCCNTLSPSLCIVHWTKPVLLQYSFSKHFVSTCHCFQWDSFTSSNLTTNFSNYLYLKYWNGVVKRCYLSNKCWNIQGYSFHQLLATLWYSKVKYRESMQLFRFRRNATY